MSIEKLIDNQIVKIDDHSQGCEVKWGKSVHLHKRMTKDKLSGVEVLIYLDESRNGEFLEFKNLEGKKSSEIKNEIKKAFKNKNTRKRFFESFFDALNKIISTEKLSHEEKKKVAVDSAKRIAESFGRDIKVKDYFIEKEDKYCIMFSRKDKEDFYVLVDTEFKIFTVAEKLSDIREITNYEVL